MNESILRAKDIQLNPLQEAEELIKKEMLIMLHYDAINHPAENQISSKHNKRAQLPARWFFRFGIRYYCRFSHVGYLERNEYIELEPEDLEEARELLLEEVLHGKTKLENLHF